jgi:hypothetical protein
MATSLGSFSFGSNPTFTLTLTQNGTNADPGNPSNLVVKLTDPNSNHTQPTVIHVSTGIYTFQISGGVTNSGNWSGRDYVGPGDPGQSSVDFSFSVDSTANP